MKPELTKRQSKVLAFIKSYIAERGYPPSARDVMKHIGATAPNGAVCHLKALTDKGYIKRDKMVARSIVVLD